MLRGMLGNALTAAESTAYAASNFYFGWEMSNQVMNWLGTPSPDSAENDARLYVGCALAVAAVGAGYVKHQVTNAFNAQKSGTHEPRLSPLQMMALGAKMVSDGAMVANVTLAATGLVERLTGVQVPVEAKVASTAALGMFAGTAQGLLNDKTAMMFNNSRKDRKGYNPQGNVAGMGHEALLDQEEPRSLNGGFKGGQGTEETRCCASLRRRGLK